MNKYFRQLEEGSIIFEKLDEKDIRYEKLAPDVYTLWDSGGLTRSIPSFDKLRDGDKLVKFRTGVVSEVLEDVDKFFTEETKGIYRDLKITHKMGLLFYGKQGTGKTSTCMLIMKELVEKHNAVCLDCTGRNLSFVIYAIHKLREAQDNPIVVFMDEFDSSLRRDENRFLTFLDGTDSVGNSIFIACTNYIEKIPDRFKKRKSRFKKLHSINSLPEGVYREYLIDRVPTMKKEEVAEFTHYAVEKGLTIDQLKHALIDHKIEKIAIVQAVENAVTFNDKEKKQEEQG